MGKPCFRFVFRSPCFLWLRPSQASARDKKPKINFRFVFRSPCTNFAKLKKEI